MKYLSPFVGLILLFAVAPISYVYYPFLLTAVCLSASLVGYDTVWKETIKINDTIAFGFLFALISILYNPILLYNPLFNIRFEQKIWNQINNFTALLFIIHYFQIQNHEYQILANKKYKERFEIHDIYESKFSFKLGFFLLVNFAITILYLMIILPIYYLIE